MSTFEWDESSSDELTQLKRGHKATSARGPEDQLRNAELLRHASRKVHQEVGDDAGERGQIRGGVELQYEVSQWSRRVLLYQEQNPEDMIRALAVRLRDAVGDGFEPEIVHGAHHI